jgi:fumarylacetoacetase
VTDASVDPAFTSWCESAQGSDFPIQNLPLGIFSVGERRRRAGVAIGDFVLDLGGIADLRDEYWRNDLSQPVLNGWLARGTESQRALRERLQLLLSDEKYRDEVEPQLIGQAEVRLHVPCLVGDYTDFYVGIHHATNVGKQFRPDNPLLPNYKYVPIGYHGRASSVRA